MKTLQTLIATCTSSFYVCSHDNSFSENSPNQHPQNIINIDLIDQLEDANDALLLMQDSITKLQHVIHKYSGNAEEKKDWLSEYYENLQNENEPEYVDVELENDDYDFENYVSTETSSGLSFGESSFGESSFGESSFFSSSYDSDDFGATSLPEITGSDYYNDYYTNDIQARSFSDKKPSYGFGTRFSQRKQHKQTPPQHQEAIRLGTNQNQNGINIQQRSVWNQDGSKSTPDNVSSAPSSSNLCEAFNTCGPAGKCNQLSMHEYNCTCLEGFYYNDRSRECQGCGTGNDLSFTMIKEEIENLGAHIEKCVRVRAILTFF